jgi:hypothetical protein
MGQKPDGLPLGILVSHIGFIWLPTFKVRQPWRRLKMEKKKFKD